MHIVPVVELPKTEKAYREWVRAYPDGFVINALKEPDDRWPSSMRVMIFHRADCMRISPATPKRLNVRGHTIKACSMTPLALTTWASLRSEPLLFCCRCDMHIG